MSVAYQKNISDWLALDSTFQLVKALANKLNIEGNWGISPNSIKTRVARTYPKLVSIKRGSPENNGGTWIHYKLAVPLAMWLSPEFALLVSDWVEEWLTTGQNPIHPQPESQTIPTEEIPDLTELLTQINNLEQTLVVSLKHRHAIHNVVEKPAVADLSLNRVIHTSIHEQGVKLNDALKQINSLRQVILNFHNLSCVIEENHNLWRNFQQVSVLVEQLRSTNNDSQKINQDLIEENQRLIKSSQEKQQRLQILCQRRQVDSSITIDINSDFSSILEQRIEQLTKVFLSQQKRKTNSRTLKSCKLKATMLARYELGESLNSIASELGYPYQTVKTYVKLARGFVRNKSNTIN